MTIFQAEQLIQNNLFGVEWLPLSQNPANRHSPEPLPIARLSHY